MKKVKIYERVLHEHYVAIEREGKIIRIDKRCTLKTACRLMDEMEAYLAQMNKGIKPPFYNLWMCHDMGMSYRYTCVAWAPGKEDWEFTDDLPPLALEGLIHSLRGGKPLQLDQTRRAL